MAESALFSPIRLGNLKLAHRVVMAPLTRFRATKEHVPLPHVQDYYAQRASIPGTLIISEATFIAQKAGGYHNAPGIWSAEQIAAWKEVTQAVHARGSFIYMQLWALGRAPRPKDLYAENANFSYVSASDIPLRERPASDPAPRALTLEEIQEYIQLYATAAANAVHQAGFDGVEIHSANGYLPDQFLQSVSNVRTDAYGGSVKNRCRFSLDVVDAVVKAVGSRKVGIRLSPWGTYQDMLMPDPKPTFTYLATQLAQRHPTLAYIHVVEPRVSGIETREVVPEGWDNDFLREIWKSGQQDVEERRYISAGGYTRAQAIGDADNGDLVAFGRRFISNPDLPDRLKNDLPLAPYDRKKFYRPGSLEPEGFTDYPMFADEKSQGKL
ncbi:hypothetical protein FB45DRAFT_929793 [Roridomyces roridus]|uniref:NADH:flavin oxidoreductase/NADH oxidase N-terminal domain-containing protein n=1 Tax=Roridomyces roridus TaxID=1738132 RepID=A0AAD7BGA9_9AGAR|nr:hypothetical protein FB45DRAFT_929793 [Roridomyces roridus]